MGFYIAFSRGRGLPPPPSFGPPAGPAKDRAESPGIFTKGPGAEKSEKTLAPFGRSTRSLRSLGSLPSVAVPVLRPKRTAGHGRWYMNLI